MNNDPLLQPWKLRHLTLKNRLMTTSHEPAYTEAGMPKARYRAYHETRARGGIALTMTAGSAVVSRDSPPAFGNILAWRDEVVPWIRELTDACHGHGCAVMIQLTHLGRRTAWNRGDWLPVVSSSHHREPAHRAMPKQLEDWDIERIVGDYADAAERMQQGGMDGIEIEAYGHLIDQFWSSFTNTRDDEYNGSLENRLRFGTQVLDAIRQRVGPDFIVGVRYTADEVEKGGITAEEGFAIAERLRDSGYVDFLNVIRGRIHTDPALTRVIPLQGMPASPHLDFAGKVRKRIGLPTFHAARIADVATARHAVANGLLDMVGMTRAHIAEPNIVRRIEAGREGDIRPCVGATYCLDRIYEGGEALCIHNAATGRELHLPHEMSPSPVSRRVLVVGAGPGGLEAARVAAERGHDVIVLEAANQPGGQVRLCAQSARRREMIGIIDWRMAQCEKRGVQFRFDTLADKEDVLQQSPDIVVIATGGLPHTEVLATGNELLLSSWDILARDERPAESVLIYDETGDQAALQAADIAAAAGSRVELITPDRHVAVDVMGMNVSPWLASLQMHNVRFTIAQRLLSVERDGNRLLATIGSDYGDLHRQTHVDQIVVNAGVRPIEDLYLALKPLSINRGRVDYEALLNGQPQPTPSQSASHGFLLYRIGDAVAGRNVHAAILDALRLMKDI